LKVPAGTGLLLIGSGLYWVLAGPLIGWFSVLNPAQIHLSQIGLTLILVTGITSLVIGLWIIPRDLEELSKILSRSDGWIFIIPILLVVADIYLTLIGLSQGNWELNPFVASAVQIGPWAVIPFLVSYMALSEGLALAMLSVGRWLFGAHRPSAYMPFALVCGAASFGSVSNAELLAFPLLGPGNYFVGMIFGMVTLSAGIYWHFSGRRDGTRLSLGLGSAT
jgi:Domain of unknown function (DUF5658)